MACTSQPSSMPHRASKKGGRYGHGLRFQRGAAAPEAVVQPQAGQRHPQGADLHVRNTFERTSTPVSHVRLQIGIGHAENRLHVTASRPKDSEAPAPARASRVPRPTEPHRRKTVLRFRDGRGHPHAAHETRSAHRHPTSIARSSTAASGSAGAPANATPFFSMAGDRCPNPRSMGSCWNPNGQHDLRSFGTRRDTRPYRDAVKSLSRGNLRRLSAVSAIR